MCNMGEECCNLSLRIIGGADGPKAGPRGHRLEKSGAGVETLSGAVGAVLFGYDPIEESFSYNITNFNSVSSRAWPRPTVGTTVVRTSAAVAVFAAALGRLAAAVLAVSGGQKKAEKGESEETFHFWEMRELMLGWCGETMQG